MAVGTVTQSITSFIEGEEYEESHDYGSRFGTELNKLYKVVTLSCVGGTGAETGTIADTDLSEAIMDEIKGMKLESVRAFPTVGGVAPDAGSIFIFDQDGIDLLGCIDGSTTPYNGLNLIHATLPRTAYPTMYIPGGGGASQQTYNPVIWSQLTLKVIDQITASAEWTIELTFI